MRLFRRSALPEARTNLGAAAQILGVMTADDVERVLEVQRTTGRGKPFGAIAVELQLVDAETLGKILTFQEELRKDSTKAMSAVVGRRWTQAAPMAAAILKAAS